MKAAIVHEFGKPLSIEEVPTPSPGEGEVLVRVELPIFETVLNGITIKGSIVGTHHDLEDVFRLHALGRTRVLYEMRPLEEVNEAFAEVESATTKMPRVVLTP